jgi:hypothetical protein
VTPFTLEDSRKCGPGQTTLSTARGGQTNNQSCEQITTKKVEVTDAPSCVDSR